jgi:glucose/arabinose dehydrogenase/PKD repeat protein
MCRLLYAVAAPRVRTVDEVKTGGKIGSVRTRLGALIAAVLVISAVAVSVVATRQSDSAVAVPAFSAADIVDEYVAGGNWYGVIAADWMSDGRMLAANLDGTILLIDPATGTSSTFFKVPGVMVDGEAGLLDISVDPDFATNKFLYVYFTEAASRQVVVARYTVGATGAATLATQTVLWRSPGLKVGGSYHVGGSVNIGPDGMLYITTGDNLWSPNSQTLSNIFGKVLRLNADGTIPTNNPFYDGTGPNIDEIWALGIRNAFRTSFDFETGDFYVAEVGGNDPTTAYEELNIVTRGANYGWPSCEGPVGQPKVGPDCPVGVTGPIYSYTHSPIGEACCLNRAIVGGAVYHGSSYPSDFDGTYVFADFPTGEISWLQRTPSGVVTGLLKNVAQASPQMPVWLDVSPIDGNIYWLSLGQDGKGQLRRLRYNGVAQRPPTITTASASPLTGPAGTPIAFTGLASDADGDALSYLWDFGDGTSSALASPTHAYAASGVYRAQLTVMSGTDRVAAPPIQVQIGIVPVPVIDPPTAGVSFGAGTTVTLTGHATDAEDGTIAPAQLSWTVVFKHDDHTHPGVTGTGATLPVAIPTTGHGYEGRTSYLVTLTATDSTGLTGSTTLELMPDKLVLPVSANIATTLAVDGVVHSLPFDMDTIKGFQHVVAVPASVCVGITTWNFSRWSTGETTPEVTFTVAAAPAPMIATYVAGAPCGAALTTTTVAATTTTVAATTTTVAKATTTSTSTTTTTTTTAAPPVTAPAAPAAVLRTTDTPQRALDTRTGVGGRPLQIPAQGEISLAIAGQNGVPSDASAAVLNVTVANPGGGGYLTVWPCGAPRPGASNLNYSANQTIPNMVISKIGTSGEVCFYSESATDVLVDVSGWFGASSPYVAVVPERILETRAEAGQVHYFWDKPTAGQVIAVDVTRFGTSNVPDSAAAVTLNITGVDATEAGYLTVWPCGEPMPAASTLNLAQGETRPNLAISKIGENGTVCIYTERGAHLLADIAGWFPQGAGFTSLVPSRVLDTRAEAGLIGYVGTKPAAGETVRLHVTGLRPSAVPSNASAVLLNITGVQAAQAGFVTVWPCGQPMPGASNLNLDAGGTAANLVLARVGDGGDVCLYTEAGTHLLADLVGWFPA